MRDEWRKAYRHMRSGYDASMPWSEMLRKANTIYFSRITKPFYFIPLRKRLEWYKAMKRGPDPTIPF